MKIVLTGDTHAYFEDDPYNLDCFWRDLAYEEPDLVIHTGDWGMLWLHLDHALEQMRDHVKCPVFTVLGNHDVWSEGGIPHKELIWRQMRLLNQYSVATGLMDWGGIKFGGFDGWYQEKYPPTNDRKFVSDKFWGYLVDRDRLAKEKVFMEQPDVLISHFPISVGEAKVFSGFGHYFFLGHWHQKLDANWFDFRIVNPGSDYGEPRFTTINI